MFKHCKHKWKVVSDTILKSGLEPGEKVKTEWSPPVNIERLLSKTHILVLACEVCGRIDKTVTRSYNP